MGPALSRPVRQHGGLHRVRVAGLPPRPDRVPARLAVRHDRAADARASRLDRGPRPGGRPGAEPRAGRPGRGAGALLETWKPAARLTLARPAPSIPGTKRRP